MSANSTKEDQTSSCSPLKSTQQQQQPSFQDCKSSLCMLATFTMIKVRQNFKSVLLAFSVSLFFFLLITQSASTSLRSNTHDSFNDHAHVQESESLSLNDLKRSKRARSMPQAEMMHRESAHAAQMEAPDVAGFAGGAQRVASHNEDASPPLAGGG